MHKLRVCSLALVLITLGWGTKVWGTRSLPRRGNCGLWINTP